MSSKLLDLYASNKLNEEQIPDSIVDFFGPYFTIVSCADQLATCFSNAQEALQ